MRRTSLGALVMSGVVLAACGGGDGGGAGVEADEPLIQITSEGGFVPVEFALSNGPRYTVLGDGRLIFQGFQTLEYPGRLVAPTMVATLSDSQLNALLAIVEDIGLSEIDDERDNEAMDMVADASTEVITYWDVTGEHRLAVYALGIEDSPSERNAAFLELIETLDRFTAEAPAEPYEAERVRVVAGEGFIDPEFEDVRPWPLEGSDPATWEELANGWHCTTIDGPTPEVFEEATQATTWEHPDGASEPMTLLVRPLHPGEADCPA
ncbi:MAG TPA: hypothetical protein VK969_08360 [Acidimicrobiia bacterium]|nr:hypothetical protein [Acidimicrobiia bacterium]